MVSTDHLQPEEEFSQEVQSSLISVSSVDLLGQICNSFGTKA